MKKFYLSSEKVRKAIIAILIAGIISVAGMIIFNGSLKNITSPHNLQVEKPIAEIGQLIEKGERADILQQQMESVVKSNDRFNDLLILNQDAMIIAAGNREAVGQAFPMIFVTNTVKGIPLPFNYKTSDFSHRSDQYNMSESPDLMMDVFAHFKAPDRSPYYLVGTVHVNSELLQQRDRLTLIINGLMNVYRICFILGWLLLALWVYLDAGKRETNAAAWGILTLLTSVIGWLVYLIARPIFLVCSSCGQEVYNDLKFCPTCGASLKSCCPQCGWELKDDWEYCGACGSQLEDET
ncbi:MAG TPA: zinc ribbon domain-containing protein [Syntrophomonadaceae bacterium]|nr:zinc ribbon domain-containing protein [Syntrophomonadaceae bacterium]